MIHHETELNLKRFPFRGVVTVVAKKLRKHRNSVLRSYRRGNPEVVAAIHNEIRHRQALIGGPYAR
ncbi:MAG: hypothetical protein DYG96_08365 [Chlorobi bacterium CHB2]|nr:hypothetical protein [Chlorobi bacterium CHB2]